MTLGELREALATISIEFDSREVVVEEEGTFRTFNTISLEWSDWSEQPTTCISLGGHGYAGPLRTFWPPNYSPAGGSNTPKQET